MKRPTLTRLDNGIGVIPDKSHKTKSFTNTKSNYIPYKNTENKSMFWQDNYSDQIDSLFIIFQNIMTERYPDKKIKWDKTAFINFVKLIRHSSSGHII